MRVGRALSIFRDGTEKGVGTPSGHTTSQDYLEQLLNPALPLGGIGYVSS